MGFRAVEVFVAREDGARVFCGGVFQLCKDGVAHAEGGLEGGLFGAVLFV